MTNSAERCREECRVNNVCLSGIVGQYGVKLSYTEQAKPQTSFTLVVAEGTYKTFIPVLIVGHNAETLAESLEPGELVALTGKLTYKAGRTKESGKLIVVSYGVEVLSRAWHRTRVARTR
jgi:single-stranded DNA-binding protein